MEILIIIILSICIYGFLILLFMKWDEDVEWFWDKYINVNTLWYKITSFLLLPIFCFGAVLIGLIGLILCCLYMLLGYSITLIKKHFKINKGG